MAEIQIAGAIGRGPTDKAAFDDALHTMGIAHCNLIGLSSVIPEGSGPIIRVPAGGKIGIDAGWGDRLYCVLAEVTSWYAPDGPAPAVIAAGIGWARHSSGRGVFVEHTFPPHDSDPATSRMQLAREAGAFVSCLIEGSLDEMLERRGWHPKEIEREQLVISTRCVEIGYTCALVVAAIEHAPWLDSEE